MSGFQVGTAFVEVTASFRGWDTALAAQSRTLGAFGDQVGKQVGDSMRDGIAKGIKDGVGDGYKSVPEESARKGRESGDAFGGEFDRQVQTKIRAALAAIPKVDITADSTEAQRKIQELRARLLELSGQRIGIDISEAEAKAKIAGIRKDLVELGNSSPSIQVRMDAAKAIAELAALQAEIKRVDGRRVNIDAKADTAGAETKLAALGGAATSAGGSISGLALAGIALGPAIIPVAAAATAAFAGLGLAAAGAVAGFGVLALAVKPVIGAVQALAQADASSATDAAAAGAAAKAKANAIASAAAQVQSSEASLSNTRDSVASAEVNAAQRVSDAERSLGTTRDSVAAAAVNAAQRVGDAQRGLADAQKQAAQGVQTALSQVASAERALAQAQAQELTAQQALTDARKSAQQQLQDYQTQLADGALSQRAALLAITRAQENLDKVNASAASTQLQRDEAKLAYDQAVQHNTDLGIQQQRLQESAKAANAAGVEGSKQVVAARTGITAANERVQTSEQALAAARAAVTAAQTKGSEQVARAQEAVATAQRAQAAQAEVGAAQIVKAQEAIGTAQRAQADQARAGAAQIAAAQASLLNAQRALQVAHEETSAAGVSGANKVAEAFKNLTPVGAEFAKFLYGLKDSFKGLSGAAQDGLLPGLQEAIRGLLPALPGLTKFVGDLAKVMGDLFVQASKALTGPFWTQFFSFIGGSAAGWLKTFAETFGNLVKGAAGLFQALAPVGDLFNTSLLKGSKSFADWAANLSTNTGFQKFLGYIKDNLPAVKELLTDAGKAFGNIIVALAPFGPKIVDGLDRLLKLVADTDPKKLGEAVAGLTGLAAAAKTLGPTLDVLDSAFAKSKIGRITEALLALGAAAAYAYEKWPAFKKIADEAGATLDSLGKDTTGKGLGTNIFDLFVQRLTDTGAEIRAKVQAISDAIRDKVWAMSDAIRDRIYTVNDAIRNKIFEVNDAIYNKIYAVNDAIRNFLLARWADISANATAWWTGITRSISGIWDGWQKWVEGRGEGLRAFLWNKWADIQNNATAWWSGITGGISGIWDGCLRWIGDKVGGLGTFLSARWADISRNATDWWSGITGGISRIWDGFLGWMRDKVTGLGTFLSARWADIQNNATAWWNGITGGISGIWDGFLRWMSEKVGGLRTFLATAWESFKTDSSRIWQGLVDGVGAIFSTIEDKVKAPIQSVLKFIRENFVGPLNAMLKAVLGEGALQIPFPPAFADGGPVGPGRVDYSGKPRGYDTGGTVFGWSPHERADNIPAMLTAEEEVIRQRSARNMRRRHPGALEWINEHGTLPGYAGGGLVRRYADGGAVWDAIKTGLGVVASQTGNPVATVANAVTSNPLDAIKKMVAAIVAGIGSNPMAQFAAGALTKVGDGLAQKVKDLLAGQNQNGAAPNASDGAGAASAVNWALGHVDTTGWLDRCLAFVNAAWGHKVGWLGLPRAIDSWNAAPGRHPGDTNPPAGAALFYTTGNPAGHVDLAVGQNSIVSTDLPTRDKLGQVDFNRPMSQWGAKYLGWAIPGGSTAAAGGAGSGNVAFSPGAGVLQWANTVQQALGMEGQDSSLGGITLRRMNQESGGNPNAINLWDSNAKAGTPSKGLMQVIDPTFNANWDPRTPHDIWNPLSNITASMKYALRQYGSLSSAYGRAGGYADGGAVLGKSVLKPILLDTGGTLPPGRSIVDNQTGGWEHLTRTDMIREGGSQSQVFNIHPSPGMDEYALALAVSQRQLMGV